MTAPDAAFDGALARGLTLCVQIMAFPIFGLNAALSQAFATGLLGCVEPW